MTDIDTNKLRHLAEAATMGPWSPRRETHGASVLAVAAVAHCGSASSYGGEKSQSISEASARLNADYIAAANPATVLALLDERENLRALLRSVLGYGIEHLVDCTIVVDSDPCSCGQRRLIFDIEEALK